MKKSLNVCQVSLKGNIQIIKENLIQFNKFYDTPNFYIICPKNEIQFFKKSLKYNKIKIINEKKIISFREFKKIANLYLKKTNYKYQIQNRLGWYYQQVLKIAFSLDFATKNKDSIIIWDADTIILKKIEFFKNDVSHRYGTTGEFHKAYYLTNNKILGELPKYFISSLTQFTSLSYSEAKYLHNKMNKNIKKKDKTSIWLTKVIFKSLVSVHKIYNGSMFSEYELIGQSNLICKKSSQKLISGLREFLDGKLTNLQKKIALVLGYSYIAYEHTHQNKLSKNMLKRDQNWYLYIKLLVRKTSNKFFRGIKHNILNKFYNG